MKFQLSKPILFRDYLRSCLNNDNTGEWMIFKDDVSEYSMNMDLYSVQLKNWDLEPEEYEEIEDEVLSQGYCNALNSDQLVDIVNNLKSQKSDYTEVLLEKAINYYSAKDCFIDVWDAEQGAAADVDKRHH